jgi:hypothetical protein
LTRQRVAPSRRRAGRPTLRDAAGPRNVAGRRRRYLHPQGAAAVGPGAKADFIPIADKTCASEKSPVVWKRAATLAPSVRG